MNFLHFFLTDLEKECSDFIEIYLKQNRNRGIRQFNLTILVTHSHDVLRKKKSYSAVVWCIGAYKTMLDCASKLEELRVCVCLIKFC